MLKNDHIKTEIASRPIGLKNKIISVFLSLILISCGPIPKNLPLRVNVLDSDLIAIVEINKAHLLGLFPLSKTGTDIYKEYDLGITGPKRKYISFKGKCFRLLKGSGLKEIEFRVDTGIIVRNKKLPTLMIGSKYLVFVDKGKEGYYLKEDLIYDCDKKFIKRIERLLRN